MKEIWKDIKGYEGLYQVSNLGNVKSLEKIHRNHKNRFYVQKEKILKFGIVRVYNSVGLCKNYKRKTYFVHRLVAQAFIPNPNNYPVVNHKDENPSNNCVDNLEWCTQKYNCNFGTGKYRCAKSKMKKVKCVEKNIIYESISDACRKTGIYGISECILHKRNRKTAGGFHWELV